MMMNLKHGQPSKADRASSPQPRRGGNGCGSI
jgi:hypothetical protein